MSSNQSPIPGWMDPSNTDEERKVLWLEGLGTYAIVQDQSGMAFQRHGDDLWYPVSRESLDTWWEYDDSTPWTDAEVAEATMPLSQVA